jgi:hypothetical protein
VLQHADLILLVVAVAPVNASGSLDAIAYGHGGQLAAQAVKKVRGILASSDAQADIERRS